jgi:outer membrane protein assembly factor BamB
MLTADPSGSFLAYESPERTIQVFKADGTPDGPRIKPGFRTGHWPAALSPRRGLVWVANFDRGTLRCYDWRTGDLRWEHPNSYKKLAALDCCGDRSLLVRQYSSHGITGPLRALDQETGEVLGDVLSGVASAFAQSGNPWIVLTRHNRIEFRQDLSNPPRWSFDTGTMEMNASLDGNVALVSQIGGLVKCFDLARGEERWRFDFGEGCWLGCPVLPSNAGFAFGLKQHRDERGSGSPVFLDLLDGRIVRTEPVLQYPMREVVDRGHTLIGLTGRLRLQSMEWTPHLQAIE